MKKILFLVLCSISLAQYGQTLSELHIIYEYKDQIVLNDGKRYKTIIEKPFYEVSDNSIEKYRQVSDHIFRLNRVLIVRSNKEYRELIEWVKDNMKYYQIRELAKESLKEGSYTTH